MKIFISADIEGVNHINYWSETNKESTDYHEYQEQMTAEVASAAIGAKRAGASTIFIKDAHDSAANLIFEKLPNYITLHKGWEGGPEMMMEGLKSNYDAVIFIGYHSGSLSSGNSLAHTMSLKIHKLTINGKLATEFLINSYYASLLKIPIAFLSGDLEITKIGEKEIPGLSTVATKIGTHGACVSEHPDITNKKIEEAVYFALTKDYSKNLLSIPETFYLEVEYRTHQEAYSASFYPGSKLINSNTISFQSQNYFDVLVFLKFVL
ncbi:MAG: M55 family metallopeptidase [Bacilli bacterium]|nr:M55 family metallopeptidase [Bacilli bacterium]